ncbi:polyamine aminopropyltransferase [Caldivirga sp.]|uniref:polyamine aminopropyltransferase n=1 Tax=Caldivirga sp. TaxID=2080243 RepID=UPI0025BBA773|nr:polyamine aminopropyltransferase [Caldivirga sp.]
MLNKGATLYSWRLGVMSSVMDQVSRMGTYFIEFETPFSWHLRAVNRVLYSGESKYQRIAVVEFKDLGKALVLDGKVQSSLFDEYVYHESLVHPAMVLNGSPERVLIIGGGEGATAREVLKWDTVKEVVMVDIDEEVVKVSKEYLPEMHGGSFYDSRFKLIIGDGRKFLEESSEKFDVIIIDATDPLEGGPSYLLYTIEFYKLAKSRLTANGVLATQATNMAYALRVLSVIYRTIGTVFSKVRPYQSYMHSYDAPWGFIVASDTTDALQLTQADVDNALMKHVKGNTRYYDGLTHVHMFTLPKHIRIALEDKEVKPATDLNPTFMPM